MLEFVNLRAFSAQIYEFWYNLIIILERRRVQMNMKQVTRFSLCARLL